MKKWLFVSVALSISLGLFSAGDVSVALNAGAFQRQGVYKEEYGAGKFAFGGVFGYELVKLYRGNVVVEFEFNMDSKKKEEKIAHIGGEYTYTRKLKRAGYALKLRYEHNFSKDGFSLSAGLQRDCEKETIEDVSFSENIWRPVVAAQYEMNLGSEKTRLFIGAEMKFNVDEKIEAGIVAGLKMNFNLFRKFEG